jgi:hypothetical protein
MRVIHPRETLPRILLRVGTVFCTIFCLLLLSSPLVAAPYVLLLGGPTLYAAVRYPRDPDYQLWALLSISWVLWILLRAPADATGMPIHYQYPIIFDRWLGMPVVFLQERFYHGPDMISRGMTAIHLSSVVSG